MATLLQRKIYRIRNRKLKRPNPIFSRKEYNKYDWMLLNILFLNENLLFYVLKSGFENEKMIEFFLKDLNINKVKLKPSKETIVNEK